MFKETVEIIKKYIVNNKNNVDYKNNKKVAIQRFLNYYYLNFILSQKENKGLFKFYNFLVIKNLLKLISI